MPWQIIPRKVKIQGRTVPVLESARGYVRVGQSIAEITQEQRERIETLEGKEAIKEWQKHMWKAFEKALKEERIRIKNK